MVKAGGDVVGAVQGGKGSTGVRRLRWGIAALLALFGAFLLWKLAFDRDQDPRAYPSSESQSLEKMLDYYHMRLPDCAEDSLRFARYSQFTSDSFYLHFTGDRACISEFLAENGLDDEDTFEQEGIPFRPGEGDEFNWPDDARQYVALDGTLSEPGEGSLVAVEIAIDYDTSPHELYLWAGIL